MLTELPMRHKHQINLISDFTGKHWKEYFLQHNPDLLKEFSGKLCIIGLVVEV
jgi:hypothetical protein